MSSIAQDLQNLPQIFAASVASNEQTRKMAEEALKRLDSSKENHAHFFKALFSLSLSSSQPQNANQVVNGIGLSVISLSAAIHLKNIVCDNWMLPMVAADKLFPDQKLSVLSEEFRAFLKSNILGALCTTEKQIQKQYISMIERMVAGFPKTWDGLTEQLQNLVKTTDKPNIKAFHGAFVVIVKVLKTFIFSKDENGANKAFIDKFLPTVFLAFENCFKTYAVNQNNILLGETCVQSCKIFYRMHQDTIPNQLKNREFFDKFISLLLEAQKLEMDRTKILPHFKESAESFWRFKRWALQMILKYFIYFSTANSSSNNEPADVKAIAEYFKNKHSRDFLKVSQVIQEKYLQSVNTMEISNDQPTEKVVNLALQYFSAVGCTKDMFDSVFKPNLKNFFQDMFLKHLSFNVRDNDNLNNNPMEYIKTNFDVVELFFHPRAAIHSIFLSLLETNGKVCLPFFFAFIEAFFQAFPGSNSEKLDFQKACMKDGVYSMLGVARELIPPNKQKFITSILAKEVLPTLQKSPYIFLRAKAAWLMATYGNIDEEFWPEPTEQAMYPILFEVAKNLSSGIPSKGMSKQKYSQTNQITGDVALRIQCASAFAVLLFHDTCKEFLKKMQDPAFVQQTLGQNAASQGAENFLNLDRVIAGYLTLMDQMGADQVVSSLGDIIEYVGPSMAGPFAMEIVNKCLESFLENYDQEIDDDEDDGNMDAAMLADSSLSTILVLLETLGGAVQEEKEALEKNPQMSKAKLESYQKLFYILESQTKIHEVLEIVFSTEDEEGFLLEYIPLAIKILNCFTFYSQEISDFSWKHYPKLCKYVENMGYDQVHDLLAPADNFISRSNKFFTDPNVNHYENTMRVIKQYFKVEVEENRKEEKLLQPCVKILSVILQNGKKENENNKVYLSPQQYYEILEIVIDNLFKAETTALQQLLADAIADGVYFNPQLFMAGFKNQPEKLLEIIQNWIRIADGFTRSYDVKLSIIGLSTLLGNFAGVLNEKFGDKRVVQKIAEFVCILMDKKLDTEKAHQEAIETAKERSKKITDNLKRAGVVDSEELLAELEDDEDPEGLFPGEEVYDDHLEEEILESVIDKIDERQFFVGAVRTIAQQNPDIFQREIGSSRLVVSKLPQKQ